MEGKEPKPLGIYIHIPFCVRKCLYCDFLSAPAGKEEQERYVEALCREIDRESINYRSYFVNTVFIGGGTPSLLDGENIGRILGKVHEKYRLSPNCEISMEANPGTVTWEKLIEFRKSGGNRLSLGLQSASDDELKGLGRIHSYQDFLKTYELAVKAGFSNINVDLMTAVPGQTVDSLMDTLQKVTGLRPKPTHISAYSLIIEEGTPFFEKTPELPDEDLERKLYKITGEFLKENGYQQYEISNYALPGYTCRHNETYWRRGNYVGFGIGAASMIDNVRFHNTVDRERYVEYYLNNVEHFKNEFNSSFARVGAKEQKNKKTYGFFKDLVHAGDSTQSTRIKEDVQILSREEQMEEFMFLGLRMTEGVCGDEFLRTFGVHIDEVYPGVVDSFCQKGLLMRRKKQRANKEQTVGEEWIALTPFGMDVSNRVMAEFLLT